MPRYRYQFVDLRTGDHITDLPLTGVSFDRRIVQAGAFSASLPITNATMADRVAAIVPRASDDLSTGPGRTLIHVWRNNNLWGSYILWSATLAGDTRGRVSVALKGAGLESWLHRRSAPAEDYVGEDQLDMARDMVANRQAGTPDGFNNMGFELGGQESSGVLRDRTYRPSDGTLGKVLEQLSEVINGPEWTIRTSTDEDGVPVREFYVAQVIGTGTTHRLTQPGTVTQWSYLVDATDAGTAWAARGPDVGDGVPQQTPSYPSGEYRDAGWPQLHQVLDYPTVKESATLTEYAFWWRAHRSGAVRILETTVRVPEEPTLTPAHLGDYVRMTLVNTWWPLNEATGAPTFDQTRRVVGMQVRPPERGTSEEMQLIFEEPRPDGAAAEGYGIPAYRGDVAETIRRQGAYDHALFTTANTDYTT